MALEGEGEAFEPDMAVSSTDPDHWIVAETPIQGLRSLRAHVTFDAGKTWTVADPTDAVLDATDLRLDGCQEWIDAGAVIAADGTAWVVAIGWGQYGASFPAGFSGPVVAFESPDGGMTWTRTHVLSPSDTLRQPCRDAATTSTSFFHAPDMSRIILDGEGHPTVTWRQYAHHPVGGTTFGIGIASWDGGWTTRYISPGGACPSPNGPQPFLDADGTLQLATLAYDADGVTGACILHEDSDGFTGTSLGAATLAWPRGTACGGRTWVVHQHGADLVISVYDGAWKAHTNISVGEGATTPSIGCLEGYPIVTAYVPANGSAFEVWWLHQDGVAHRTLGDSSQQTMGIDGMGHYMDIEASGSDAVAVWVSDTQGPRQVHVARLSGLLDPS